MDKVFDFVIIGSGFGGSVPAMRLAEKGYSVAVLEKGKRFELEDFPKSNWDVRKFLWAPIIKCFGIQQITLLKKLMVLHGSGVGGGSLVYANTHLVPEDEIFRKTDWPSSIDWLSELKTPYEKAKHMLGVCQNPTFEKSEEVLQDLAKELGKEDSFARTDVAIYFNDKPGEMVDDPYFNGKGPKRAGCNSCGGCMIGCRVGAKNTLEYNYLYFAQQNGTEIFPETTVDKIQKTNEGYEVETYSSTSLFKKKSIFRAKKVILSAGALGTMSLLMKNKFEHGTLKNISPTLGSTVRTNGESLLGATTLDSNMDLSTGIAIGAEFKADDVTKIEAVKYPSGSGVMRFLTVPFTGSGNAFLRPLKLVLNYIVKLPEILRLWMVKDWAKHTVILLVMRSTDTQMKLSWGRSIYHFFFKGLKGNVIGDDMPSYIPIAQKACLVVSRLIKGVPQNGASEVLIGTPATAHILGGAVMADNADKGVINSSHEVYSYPGLYISDASAIPTNLAVNPSLTITALAERFCTQFPNKEEL